MLPLGSIPSHGTRTTDAPNPLTSEQQDLWEAAQGFEAIMLNELLKGARQSELGSDLFESQGADTAQSLLDTELSRISAGRSNLGIAAAVYRQFAPMVSGSNNE